MDDHKTVITDRGTIRKMTSDLNQCYREREALGLEKKRMELELKEILKRHVPEAELLKTFDELLGEVSVQLDELKRTDDRATETKSKLDVICSLVAKLVNGHLDADINPSKTSQVILGLNELDSMIRRMKSQLEDEDG